MSFSLLPALADTLPTPENHPSPENWEKLLEQGQYERVIEWLQNQPPRFESYYNLGSAYFQMDQYGIAAAYFQMAKSLNPFDVDARYNYELAYKKAAEQLGAERMDPGSNAFEKIADLLPLRTLLAPLSALAVVIFLFWLRLYLETPPPRRPWQKPSFYLAQVALMGPLFLLGVQKYAAHHPAGICTQQSIVRSGPGERFLEMGEVVQGMKVRLLGPIREDGEQNPWIQVRFGAEQIGWIPKNALLLLQPQSSRQES